MPPKTTMNPVIHGRIDRGDYTVAKVYFESLPGFRVTGNLYRPKGKHGRRPGVLYAHGHFPNGRFYEASVAEVRKQIVEGAERFEEGGRSMQQAICVQLARMGCVAFHYDMIGYADNAQIPFEIAHGFAKQRPGVNTTKNWGLFSPPAESHFQSIMGLQTWNSIRSLDFLAGLPDVDPRRIAVTGASGGGTQTMILCALDPRPALAFPAVMVSTAMQGGCSCENASGLRIGAGNIEFAALSAPKPQGMTTADDWTKEMAAKGFPELKQLYTLLGSPDKVMLHRGEHFEHNYNYVSRAAFYQWLNRHLKLGLPEPIMEGDYKRLTKEELSVWDAGHPPPPRGPEFERQLLRQLTETAAKQLDDACRTLNEFRRTFGPAVDIVIGRTLADAGRVEWTPAGTKRMSGHTLQVGRLRNKTHHEELPVVLLEPKSSTGRTVIWVDETGKAGLFAAKTASKQACVLKPEIKRLLDAGVTVVGADLMMQGEFLADGRPVDRTRLVDNPREVPAFTFGYNPSLFAQRVHDILTLVAFVQSRKPKTARILLAGLEGAGPWVAAARTQCRDAIKKAAIDTGGFRFGSVLDMQAVNFLPGGAKYGDLPGMLALGAPGKLWVAGENDASLALVRKIYRQAHADKALTCFPKDTGATATEAVEYLLKP